MYKSSTDGPSVPPLLLQLAWLLCSIWRLASGCGDVPIVTPLYRMAPQEQWLEPWFNADSRPLCTPFGLLFVCQGNASHAEVPHHVTRSHWHVRGHVRWNTSHAITPISGEWRLSEGGNVDRSDTDRTLQALKLAFETATTASPLAYRRAVREGDSTRLRRALRALVAGEPTKIVLLGGSVAVGMGVPDRNTSFAGLLSKWFHLFEPLVGSNVEFVNSAVAATTSSYASQCVDDFVPKDTDIVFLEYALNDWEVTDTVRDKWMDNNHRRGYERLIRKILAFPNSPAVILVHWWAPRHFKLNFWNVAEDEFDTMGKYYDLSSISFRNAYYHQIKNGTLGFIPETFMCDNVHPNILGHRYFGDLVIAHLQVSLAEALLLPAEERPGLKDVPPPLFKGNNATAAGKCVRDDAFKQTVVSAEGFEWINQAREGAHQAKWGYAGSQPGSSLSIQVGMGNATDGNATTPRQTLVGLGVLKSYEGMGKASVSCVPPSHVQPQDCSCGFWQIDMHHEHHTSQVYWVSGLVRTGAECLLRVAIDNSTSSGGHRVVVTSLMVGDDDIDDANVFSAFGFSPIEIDGDNVPH